jgi:hypothetical protein
VRIHLGFWVYVIFLQWTRNFNSERSKRSRDEIRKAVISGVVEIMGLVEGWKRVYRGMEREQHKYVKVEKLGEVRERGRKSRVRIIEVRGTFLRAVTWRS